jgi:hypothetical protein
MAGSSRDFEDVVLPVEWQARIILGTIAIAQLEGGAHHAESEFNTIHIVSRINPTKGDVVVLQLYSWKHACKAQKFLVCDAFVLVMIEELDHFESILIFSRKAHLAQCNDKATLSKKARPLRVQGIKGFANVAADALNVPLETFVRHTI